MPPRAPGVHTHEEWKGMAPSFALFCQEVLAWQPGDLHKPEELAAPIAVTLDDYDEVLRPDWVVPEPSQGHGPLKAQLLVQELPLATPFDALPKGADGRRCWEATPQQRWERLRDNRSHLEKRLARIERDLELEPDAIRRTFAVATAPRIEPAGAMMESMAATSPPLVTRAALDHGEVLHG